MRGHGLMQAIARVNRVFRDKPAGLVVDYIGIAQRLKEALGQYSPSDRERTGVDTAKKRAHRRYHTNAISTVEVLQELIDMAKDLRAAQARGEAEGLSQDELAFYDALAENESAVEVMGSDELKVIAHELLVKLQGNVTVDWAHRESARAKMRVLVKRILKKYGYPPDLQAAAVQTVLALAEVWSKSWVA